MSTGPSTGNDPARISSSQRLARAILYRAAKDLRTDWSTTAMAKGLCEAGAIEHGAYVKAVEFLKNSPEAQRPILLQAMKRRLQVR